MAWCEVLKARALYEKVYCMLLDMIEHVEEPGASAELIENSL
jgi:hypothetical protein